MAKARKIVPHGTWTDTEGEPVRRVDLENPDRLKDQPDARWLEKHFTDRHGNVDRARLADPRSQPREVKLTSSSRKPVYQRGSVKAGDYTPTAQETQASGAISDSVGTLPASRRPDVDEPESWTRTTLAPCVADGAVVYALGKQTRPAYMGDAFERMSDADLDTWDTAWGVHLDVLKAREAREADGCTNPRLTEQDGAAPTARRTVTLDDVLAFLGVSEGEWLASGTTKERMTLWREVEAALTYG